MSLTTDAYNARELARGAINATHLTAMTRLAQRALGLEDDGMCGPATRAALDAVRSGHVTPLDPEPGEPPDQRDDITGPFHGPLSGIPRSRSQIRAVFGNPGTVARPIRKWKRRNIITVRDLPGVPPRWFFKCHRDAEPYMREGLRRAKIASGYEIARAGGFVHRHIQHDVDKPLSLHSFGIAVDFDSDRNFAKKFKRGRGPIPWSAQWMSIWPNGVDQAFVEAMESVGFTWGGVWGRRGTDFGARSRRCSFFDPMHFELRDR